jgi:hypothetical protein
MGDGIVKIGGRICANTDQRIGTRHTFSGGKKAILTTDGLTWGNTPNQIFQTPNSARRSQGESGPRIGVDGKNGWAASVTGHCGTHTSKLARQKNTGKRRIGAEGSGASGNFFTSMQQWPSSFPSHSGQHFGFSESEVSVAVQPGRSAVFSMKQTRTVEA